DAHDSLAAGLVGAAGALFAAWIAWTAVQRQLEVQQQQASVVDRAYISGGGGYRIYIGDDGAQHWDTTKFVLTVENYGKTRGTVTAYAVFVCDRADLPRNQLIWSLGTVLHLSTEPIRLGVEHYQ